MFYSWFVGYKNPIEEEVKTEDKTAVIEGNKDTVIVWRNYEEEINKIKEELKQLKIESDERWKRRLSPCSSETELCSSPNKKRRKHKK